MNRKIMWRSLSVLVGFLLPISLLVAQEELTIGSPAPKLDVEHWVSTGLGEFKPITQFKQGRVYVVVFWATWSRPSVSSLLPVSKLQQEFADKGVQIISVSDESLPVVNKFLERSVREGDGSYGELTAGMLLATDSDRSTYKDYLLASGQSDLPLAFVVGKSGVIEWIGLPTQLEEPLKNVVAGSWNRDQFHKSYVAERALEKRLGGVFRLFSQGKMKQGLEKLDALVDEAPAAMQLEMKMTQFSIMASEGMAEATNVFLDLVKQSPNDPKLHCQLAWTIVEMVESGSDVDPEVLKTARKLVDSAVKARPGDASMLDIQAHLLYLMGDVSNAIAIETRALGLEKDPMIKRDMESFLKRMRREGKSQRGKPGREEPAKRLP